MSWECDGCAKPFKEDDEVYELDVGTVVKEQDGSLQYYSEDAVSHYCAECMCKLPQRGV